MARRSRKASTDGIQALKATLKQKKWSQTRLADVSGCTRPTIWSLLQGNAIDAEIFSEICAQLELSEYKIAEAGQEEGDFDKVLEIDVLVRGVRQQLKSSVKRDCGSMQILNMHASIDVEGIYTDVYILEEITGQRRLTVTEILERVDPKDFERFGLNDQGRINRVSGLEAVERFKKLVLLGKPGAGKTTFLKRLATQCILGQFYSDLVPIFITLKEFSESDDAPTLLEYVSRQLRKTADSDVAKITEQLLSKERILFLLDGLDEVRHDDKTRVIESIRQLSEKFPGNRFVITCRIAAREFRLESFAEVEIADFDDFQIGSFVTKWFSKEASGQTEKLRRKIEQNHRIKELASSPLLLTLFCITFAETGNLPDSRSSLYEDALNVLLVKWDTTRKIERDEIYKHLKTERKKDMLSQLAFRTFEEEVYFFSQDLVKRYIGDYITNLPGSEEDSLQEDSEAVLKSIQEQHGLLIERASEIYSFSHLSFQEYFTARHIICSVDLKLALTDLVQKITKKNWREVFPLTVEMLANADFLLCLMKDKIDALLMKDSDIQNFLSWIELKAASVNTPYKLPAIRAFYFALALHLKLDLALTLDLDPDFMPTDPLGYEQSKIRGLNHVRAINRINAMAYESSLSRALDCAPDLAFDRAINNILSVARTIALIRSHINPQEINRFFDGVFIQTFFKALLSASVPDNSYLLRSLLSLKDELPKAEDTKAFEDWWQTKSLDWIERLRAVVIEHRSISHNWQFSDVQKNLLQQYYDNNLLLVECLNSNCYVSRSVRQDIEDTLLLPLSE
jgi:predicted NACHT family NTPase